MTESEKKWEQEEKEYEQKLLSYLKLADTIRDNPTWNWCDLCSCLYVKCEKCNNNSCNGSGCGHCSDLFYIAIALSWTSSGALIAEMPQWYKELHSKLEAENSSEQCFKCQRLRLDFAFKMIIDRENTELKLSEFICEEHPGMFASFLVEQFYSRIKLAEFEQQKKSTNGRLNS